MFESPLSQNYSDSGLHWFASSSAHADIREKIDKCQAPGFRERVDFRQL